MEVVETRHALRAAEWLAAHPQARAEDLMEAFADPGVAGIISTIGGDDSIRVLPFLDLAVIRDNPKVFLGFSDTTVTHLACHKAGLGTFYGPSDPGRLRRKRRAVSLHGRSGAEDAVQRRTGGPDRAEYRRLDGGTPRLGRAGTPRRNGGNCNRPPAGVGCKAPVWPKGRC